MAHNTRYEYRCSQGHWHKYPWRPQPKLSMLNKPFVSSFNGRTTGSEPVNESSILSETAKKRIK